MGTPPRIRIVPPERISPLRNWQAELVKPYRLLMSRHNAVLANSLRLALSSFESPIQKSLANYSFRLQESIKPLLTSFIKPFPALTNPNARVAEKLGWVLHHTLPATLLDETPEEELDEAILTYYTEEWATVRETIERDIQGYLIGDDSKETMRQALIGHETGLCRLVPRAMLPEIEAVLRNQMNENVSDKIDIRYQIDRLGQFPASWMRDLTSGLSGYRSLKDFLYKHIDTETDRNEVAANSIPNRHAATHGLVHYATEKTSLNSIFLADFVFHVISELKKDKIKEAAGILKDRVLSEQAKPQGRS